MKNSIKELKGKHFLLEDHADFLKQIVRELTASEYNQLLKANDILFEFKYHQRKFREIQLNYDEYFSVVDFWKTSLKKKKNRDMDVNYDDAYIDINRVFINFITSLKAFVEHVEGRLKKEYGVNSGEVNEFKRMTRYYYENYFSYRLFIKLRDFSIHSDYPIQNLDYSNNKDGVTFVPSFNKQELLKNKEIRKKLKFDIDMMNETFPVYNQMLEIQKCLGNFLPKMVEIERERYSESAELTLKYYTMSQTRENVSIGYLEEDERRKKVGWRKILLPKDTAMLIMNEHA